MKRSQECARILAKNAGAVECRRNRMSGTIITLYDGIAAGIESDPELRWCTVCEDHSTLTCHSSLSLARRHMAVPEWCEECQAIMESRKSNPYTPSSTDEQYFDYKVIHYPVYSSAGLRKQGWRVEAAQFTPGQQPHFYWPDDQGFEFEKHLDAIDHAKWRAQGAAIAGDHARVLDEAGRCVVAYKHQPPDNAIEVSCGAVRSNPCTPGWPVYEFRVRQRGSDRWCIQLMTQLPGQAPRFEEFGCGSLGFMSTRDWAIAGAEQEAWEHSRREASNPNAVLVRDERGRCVHAFVGGERVECPSYRANPYTPSWPRYELKVEAAESYIDRHQSRRIVYKWKITMLTWTPEGKPKFQEIGFSGDLGKAERIAFDYANKLHSKEPRNPNDIRVFNNAGKCIFSIQGAC